MERPNHNTFTPLWQQIQFKASCQVPHIFYFNYVDHYKCSMGQVYQMSFIIKITDVDLAFSNCILNSWLSFSWLEAIFN